MSSDDLTEYEKTRLQNIERNKKLLLSLDIPVLPKPVAKRCVHMIAIE